MIDAMERVGAWRRAWERSGRLILLLDFDGTLAPIVERPELAAIPRSTRDALERLRSRPGVEIAVVSGRGLADVRERAGLGPIAYAGNHGMEIDGAGLSRIHPEAAAMRPLLDAAGERIADGLRAIDGAFLEDKGLTLSIHYRQAPSREAEVRAVVEEATADEGRLRTTSGKMVLEVRPRVEWDKGRAVGFLLDRIAPPPDAPVLYFGDDTTDEDAFRALVARGGGGEGVLVAEEEPSQSAAGSRVATPEAVGAIFEALAAEG